MMKILFIFGIDNVNDVNMNFQQLEYIVALDKYKSFSKAAEACFITQATLSTMVKRLEDELGLILFDRKTTPVITTDSGREIVEEAKQVLLHNKRIKRISEDAKTKVEGDLTIGIIPTVAGSLLHRFLPTLMKKHPKLILNIHEMVTGNIVEALKDGDLDVGIISTPIDQKELVFQYLYDEKLYVYGKLENSKLKYARPEDIQEHRVWLLEQGNCLSDQVVELCELNPKKMKSSLQFKPNSFDSLLNIVDRMNGLTLIPELFYEDLPTARKKKCVPFKAPVPTREISLVFHRPFAKHRLIGALAQEIRSAVRAD